jgi:hypothetical protein
VVAADKVELDATVELELDELDMCRVLLTFVSMLLTLEAELSSIVEDSDQWCWASIFLKSSTWIWSGVRIRTPSCKVFVVDWRHKANTVGQRPERGHFDRSADPRLVESLRQNHI